jgi:CDGSH-type Zn-finger protein
MATTITIRDDGPTFIAPDQVDQVTLGDHEGDAIQRPGRPITLRRCGASASKPFCPATAS